MPCTFFPWKCLRKNIRIWVDISNHLLYGAYFQASYCNHKCLQTRYPELSIGCLTNIFSGAFIEKNIQTCVDFYNWLHTFWGHMEIICFHKLVAGNCQNLMPWKYYSQNYYREKYSYMCRIWWFHNISCIILGVIDHIFFIKWVSRITTIGCLINIFPELL